MKGKKISFNLYFKKWKTEEEYCAKCTENINKNYQINKLA